MTEYTPSLNMVREIYGESTEEGLAAFDRMIAIHDAEIRADEREKAAQRLIKAQPWTNSNETYLTTEYAVFIVRGGEQE